MLNKYKHKLKNHKHKYNGIYALSTVEDSYSKKQEKNHTSSINYKILYHLTFRYIISIYIISIYIRYIL